MTQLTVWPFEGPSHARDALRDVTGLGARDRSQVHDGAVVEWPSGQETPRAEQLRELSGAESLPGDFWDMFFGLLYLLPLLVDPGEAPLAVWGSLSDVGIDERFITDVRTRVVPGGSALCLIAEDRVVDVLRTTWREGSPDPVSATLRGRGHHALHEVFAPGEADS